MITKKAARIGITYADIDTYGDGHKAPALEFEKIIRNSPHFNASNDEIVLLPRKSRTGTIPIDGQYDMVITTGLGAVNNAKGPKLKNSRFSTTASNLNYKYLLNYNPDVPTSNNTLNMPVGHKNELNLVFGRDVTSTLPNSWYAGQVSPLIDKSVVTGYTNPIDRNAVFQELEDYWRNLSPDTPNYNQHLKDLPKKLEKLQRFKNKRKLGSISGSGMGTYVSQRALETAQELDNLPNADDIGIIALRGSGAKDPRILSQIAKKNKNVLVIDEKLPRDLFTKLQRVADVNWGSSGAASFNESLLSDNVFALPKKWGAKITSFDTTPDSIAGRQYENLKKYDGNVSSLNPLWYHGQDTFNEGQLSLFKDIEGTAEVNSGRDFLNLLNDDARLNTLKLKSGQRAKQLRQEYFKNRSQMEAMIGDFLKGYNKYKVDPLQGSENLVKTVGTHFKNLSFDEDYTKAAPYIKGTKTKIVHNGTYDIINAARQNRRFNKSVVGALAAAGIGAVGTDIYLKNRNS
jgi:hypothetical protein